jgi:hypothetical protein
MTRSDGLALAPWGVLGSGKIRTNAEEARRKESGKNGREILNPNWERSPAEKNVCDDLEEIGTGERHGMYDRFHYLKVPVGSARVTNT